MMESEEIVTVEDDQSENVQPENESTNFEKKIETLLPLSRMKKICKLDPDVHMLTSDALKIVTFSAERFIECLAKEASLVSREDGRKTVQLKDIERAIRRNPLFEFLEDALSDWPDVDPSREGIPSDTQNQDETIHEDEDNLAENQDNILEEDIPEDEENLLQEDPMEVEEVSVLEESSKSIENPQSTPVKIRDIEDL